MFIRMQIATLKHNEKTIVLTKKKNQINAYSFMPLYWANVLTIELTLSKFLLFVGMSQSAYRLKKNTFFHGNIRINLHINVIIYAYAKPCSILVHRPPLHSLKRCRPPCIGTPLLNLVS